ncbi:unknown [Coprobacillus sp. CAG:698]|nr:unknown [Coprobacillus sp. CAG:698]
MSIPRTSFTDLLKYNPILPIPQNKSSTFSVPCGFIAFTISSYNFVVCSLLSWKNDCGEILKFKCPNLPSICSEPAMFITLPDIISTDLGSLFIV